MKLPIMFCALPFRATRKCNIQEVATLHCKYMQIVWRCACCGSVVPARCGVHFFALVNDMIFKRDLIGSQNDDAKKLLWRRAALWRMLLLACKMDC